MRNKNTISLDEKEMSRIRSRVRSIRGALINRAKNDPRLSGTRLSEVFREVHGVQAFEKCGCQWNEKTFAPYDLLFGFGRMGPAYLNERLERPQAFRITVSHLSFMQLTLETLGLIENKCDLSFAGDESDHLQRIWSFLDSVAAEIARPRSSSDPDRSRRIRTHPRTDDHLESVSADNSENVGSLRISQLKELTRRQAPTQSFFGRESELQRLTDLLRPQTCSPLNPFITVCGLPGIGKTRLVVEVILKLKHHFTGFCWCCGTDRASIVTDLVLFATSIGAPLSNSASEDEHISNVLSFLAADNRRWLLIIDNACKPNEIIDILSAAPVPIVVTSRFKDWSHSDHHFYLDALSLAAATTLLDQTCKLESRTQAVCAARSLGCHPSLLLNAALLSRKANLPFDKIANRHEDLIEQRFSVFPQGTSFIEQVSAFIQSQIHNSETRKLLQIVSCMGNYAVALTGLKPLFENEVLLRLAIAQLEEICVIKVVKRRYGAAVLASPATREAVRSTFCSPDDERRIVETLLSTVLSNLPAILPDRDIVPLARNLGCHANQIRSRNKSLIDTSPHYPELCLNTAQHLLKSYNFAHCATDADLDALDVFLKRALKTNHSKISAMDFRPEYTSWSEYTSKDRYEDIKREVEEKGVSQLLEYSFRASLCRSRLYANRREIKSDTSEIYFSFLKPITYALMLSGPGSSRVSVVLAEAALALLEKQEVVLARYLLRIAIDDFACLDSVGDPECFDVMGDGNFWFFDCMTGNQDALFESSDLKSRIDNEMSKENKDVDRIIHSFDSLARLLRRYEIDEAGAFYCQVRAYTLRLAEDRQCEGVRRPSAAMRNSIEGLYNNDRLRARFLDALKNLHEGTECLPQT